MSTPETKGVQDPAPAVAAERAIEQQPLTRDDLVPFVATGLIQALKEDLTAARDADLPAPDTPKVEGVSGRSEVVHAPFAMLEPPVVSTAWPHKLELLGVEVSITTYEQLARLFIEAGRRNEPALATFLPVHGIVTAATDISYRYRINAFDVVAPDGQPVRWALNWLHRTHLRDRVSGPEMMLRICERAAEEGVSIYLYGSTKDTLNRLREALLQRFPNLQIAGWESPPFRALTREENQAACERINASGAGLVFIGLGLPRQDFFAHQNRYRIKAVQLCVGAAFDFHAGKKKLAPLWMQKCGLEWTYRLIQEPRRLWKRYLFTNTMFVYMMGRAMLGLR